MGFVFLYSGYTKLNPIEPFEYTFVDLGISNWFLAPFIARFMIGLELFIGFLLIMGLFLKRFTLKLTVISLIIFCIYLGLIMIYQGNHGNCGCFGTAIIMTPLQALVKNAIMLVICIILYVFYDGFNYQKAGKWLLGAALLFSLALPHVLNGINLNYSEAYLTKKGDSFFLELDSVYKGAKIHTPPKTLSTGKHIMAFMSMTCSHCRIAAKKLRLIKEKNQAIPIYFVLNGEYANIQPFFDDTKARNIDFCVLNGKNFMYLAGQSLPAIYLVNQSLVEHQVNYMELDQTEIEKWLSKP